MDVKFHNCGFDTIPVTQGTRRDIRRRRRPEKEQGRIELNQGNVGVTKAELIEEVSKVVEVTRKDSEGIVEAIFGGIVGSLHRGEKIEIRGFGSFRTRQRQPRVGRNPKTGTRVEVPSKSIPYFKPSKELRELVNQSSQSAAPSGSGDAAAQHFPIEE
jgi:integration host factor subunit beta